MEDVPEEQHNCKICSILRWTGNKLKTKLIQDDSASEIILLHKNISLPDRRKKKKKIGRLYKVKFYSRFLHICISNTIIYFEIKLILTTQGKAKEQG